MIIHKATTLQLKKKTLINFKSTGKLNLEREGEGHDDICNHNILQVYNKVRLGGDAKKHPCSHSVEGQAQQKEKGVEYREDHCLQHVVSGAGAVGVAVIAR